MYMSIEHRTVPTHVYGICLQALPTHKSVHMLCTCLYTCLLCTCLCVCLSTCPCMYLFTCLHTQGHAHVYAHVHIPMHVYKRCGVDTADVDVMMGTYVHTCLCTCPYTCLYICLYACLYTCLYTCRRHDGHVRPICTWTDMCKNMWHRHVACIQA